MVATNRFVNSLGLTMVRISAGQFKMRTPPPLLDVPHQSRGFESPFEARDAVVESDFHLAEFAVTNRMYRQFVQEAHHPEPSGHMLDVDRVYQGVIKTWQDERFKGDDHPVVGLIHPDADAFCQWLSKKEGRQYRLATVTEWEYACRADTQTAYYWGDHADPGQCNFQASRVGHTVAVGSYQPNPWGLYDMIGNAAELTSTRWGSVGRYYIKGGSWCHPAWWLDASSYMATYSEGNASQYSMTVGFRLCCDADQGDARQGDLAGPSVAATRACAMDVPQLKIDLGEVMNFGASPANEASLLTCWDPAKGPNSPRDTWIVWDRRTQDGGKTWQPCQPLPHTAAQLSDGTIMAVHEYKGRPDNDGYFDMIVSKDAWQSTETTKCHLHLPEAKRGIGVIQGPTQLGMKMAPQQGLIELADSTLLMACYAQFEGDLEHEDYCGGFMIEEDFCKARAVLLESQDGGANWRLRATIANYPSFSREGCDEPDIVLLPNGDLFCAMRTGLTGYKDERGTHDEPVLTAWSSCQGHHWSDVQKVYVNGELITGIFPRIVVLNNGVLGFIRSRPGSSVVLNPDGTGAVWTDEVTLTDSRAGTMNALRQIGPNTMLAAFRDLPVGQDEHKWDLKLQAITVTKH